MDRLIAQDAILRTLYLLKRAEDTLDAPLLKSLYHPTQQIIFDLTEHLPSIGIKTLASPTEVWDTYNHALSGFTATQHALSNPVFEFPAGSEGEITSASVSVNAIAYHCIDDGKGKIEEVTGRGVQITDMVVHEGRWVITRMKVARGVPLDNPGLYDVAAARVDKGLGRKAKE